jgi:hypothetical protein
MTRDELLAHCMKAVTYDEMVEARRLLQEYLADHIDSSLSATLTLLDRLIRAIEAGEQPSPHREGPG